jgi:hypothetical protein
MRSASVMQCVWIALGIAVALPVARAADIPVPEQEGMPPIQQCVVTSLTVDGLPVVQHGWCYWDTEQRMWVPLSSDLARKRVFGIRPIRE